MNAIDFAATGGGDAETVTTAIAAVVSAFQSGAAILERMKRRGAPSLASPVPRVLEESIVQAPDEIQRERLRGILRFGPQFESGDVTAVIALQRITIQLQNSLLNKLRDVEDGEADIMALARAADLGRDNTITTLIALRQRLAQAEMTRETQSTPATSARPPSTQGHPAMSPPREQYYPPPVPPKNNSRRGENPVMPFSPATNISRFTYREVEEDQFEIQSTFSASRPQSERNISVRTAGPRRQSMNSDQSGSTGQSPHRTTSHDSVRQVDKTYPLNFIIGSQYPSRSNNYLGFCKAAWNLQCGDDKAMTKAKDFTQSAQSKYYFLSCSKARCSFTGRDQSAMSNRAITDLTRGIRYRWSFLAKSHAPAKSPQEDQFTFVCMFCAFAGHKSPPMKLSAFLEHISHQHRGNGLSEVILHRTCCIQGRICYDNETFDINLLPLEEMKEGRARDSGYVGSPRLGVDETPATIAELSAKRRTQIKSDVFELGTS
ncbi:uncharacterized protein LTR77_007003 [Saxophila tyrrhenica]|uniref:Uncharacterized protein n=1 Tax=Saxophila tyrrhenica TaxID=1690608 RepID=A0AAV9P9B4_9PEZI|nr:hypothetical protein LTR77_007003 [Saxophila tyrrhenica]